MQLELISPEVSAARLGRDIGMQRAEDHANRVSDGWSDRAYEFFVDYAVSHKGNSFMGEDVRAAASGAGFECPPDDRAWGPVVRRAVKEGIIKRIGYGPKRGPSSHCAPQSIWVAAIKK